MEKEYKIPITWQSYKRYKVKANDLEEAVEKALKQFLSEPDETYVDDSFDIDSILEEECPDESFDMERILNKL